MFLIMKRMFGAFTAECQPDITNNLDVFYMLLEQQTVLHQMIG